MKLFFALLISLCLVGCIGEEQKASLQKQIDQSDTTCSAGPDCEAKWGRAKEWIEVNTRWDIQTANDTLIRTYGPYDTSDPTLVAHKKQDAEDPSQYKISLEVLCNNFMGCAPPTLELQAGFAQFINDTIPDDASAATDSAALGIELVPGGKAGGNAGKTGGVFIASITPGSPAARAGLHVGDQLLKLNGRSIASLNRANELLSNMAGGATFPVEIARGASQMIIYVRL